MKKLRSIFLLLLCGGFFLTFALGSSSDATSSTDSEGTQSETHDLKSYKINSHRYYKDADIEENVVKRFK